MYLHLKPPRLVQQSQGGEAVLDFSSGDELDEAPSRTTTVAQSHLLGDTAALLKAVLALRLPDEIILSDASNFADYCSQFTTTAPKDKPSESSVSQEISEGSSIESGTISPPSKESLQDSAQKPNFCHVCMLTTKKTLTAPCGHSACPGCWQTWLTTTLKSSFETN